MDIRTLYLTLGITYLVVPIGIYQASRNSRDRQLFLWCGSWAVTGIGAILVGVRGSVPDILSYLLAHTLFMLGYVLRIKALLLELQEAPTAIMRSLRPRIAFAAIYLMIFSLTVYLDMNEMSRLILVSAVLMLNFLDLVWVGGANQATTPQQWILNDHRHGRDDRTGFRSANRWRPDRHRG